MFNYIGMAVLKKFINLLLILAVGASVAAGIPLHSAEQECSMGGEMDCCKKALQAVQTPQVAAARLCCAVNCSTEGTTNPTSNPNLSPPAVSAHPAPAVLNSYSSLDFVAASHGPPAYSEPAYIRHLALLI